MKKLFSVLSICFASLALNAQTTVGKSEITKPNPPANFRGIIISFGKTNGLDGCTPNIGLCITWNKTKADLANYQLAVDEGKGQAWAQNAGNGTTQIVYDLSEVNVSPEVYEKAVLRKKYSFAEDTYVPAELVAKLYKDAGISKVPAQVKIAKGDYTANAAEGTTTARVGKRLKWKIIITIPPNEKTTVEVSIAN